MGPTFFFLLLREATNIQSGIPARQDDEMQCSSSQDRTRDLLNEPPADECQVEILQLFSPAFPQDKTTKCSTDRVRVESGISARQDDEMQR